VFSRFQTLLKPQANPLKSELKSELKSKLKNKLKNKRRINPSQIKWMLTAAFVPFSVAIASTPANAQNPDLAATANTVCAYNPESGVPNPLGMRAFITVGQVENNSVFVNEQFPSPVSTAASVEGAEEDAAASEPATIASQRTLTLFNTPIEEARVRVVNNPTYYAELLGTSVESLGTSGFSEVNDTLTCEDNGVAATPTPPAPQSTFADLPDGNYRLASADFPLSVVDTQALLESESIVYLFRKSGDEVVGEFFYPETDSSICISGTIEGNVVTGQGALFGTEATVPDSDFLTVANQSMGNRFSNVTLNLESFSRINAGTVLPPQSC